MGDEHVEQLWYAFCIVKGIVLLSFLWVLGLICKGFLCLIRSMSARRRPVRPSVVHALGTLRAPRNFNAAGPNIADRSLGERKERMG